MSIRATWLTPQNSNQTKKKETKEKRIVCLLWAGRKASGVLRWYDPHTTIIRTKSGECHVKTWLKQNQTCHSVFVCLKKKNKRKKGNWRKTHSRPIVGGGGGGGNKENESSDLTLFFFCCLMWMINNLKTFRKTQLLDKNY